MRCFRRCVLALAQLAVLFFAVVFLAWIASHSAYWTGP